MMAQVNNDILEQRTGSRRPFALLGNLRVDDTYFDGIILNTSDQGFAARLARELEVGSWVELSCDGSSGRAAEVVWRNGGDHGFKFADYLSGKSEPIGAQAPAVIWVNFNTASVVDGPLFERETRKYPGFVQIGLLLTLASAAWMLVIGVTVIIAGFLR